MDKQVFLYFLRNRPLFMSMFRSREIELYRRYLSLSGKVLDFGSGDGSFLFTIKKFYPRLFHAAKITGIDVNKVSLEESRAYGIYDKLVGYDGSKLPFSARSFDTVFSNCVFEHLPELELNVSEMFRVLKPGGKLFTTVMAAPWDDYVLLPKSFWRKKQVHLNLLTVEEWQRLFKKIGFTVKKTVGYINKPQSRLIEVSHFLSIPYLISYRLTQDWSKVGPLYTRIVPTDKIVDMFKKDIPIEQAAALYFTLQKPSR